MKTRSVVLLCCLTLAAVFAYAQGAGFQTAKVISVERVAADAKHMENSDNYKISMRIADTIYKCTINAPAATFMSWTNGKEYPARVVNDKTLEAKNTDGQLLEFKITGKKQVK